MSYKFLYYFLALVPQVIGFFFSRAMTQLIAGQFIEMPDNNQDFLYIGIFVFFWLIVYFVLWQRGIFNKMRFEIDDYLSDVLKIFGFAILLGILESLWEILFL